VRPEPLEAGLVEEAGWLALVAVLAGGGSEVTAFTTEGVEVVGLGVEAVGLGVEVSTGVGVSLVCRHWEYHGFCSTQVQPDWQIVPPVQLIPPHCSHGP